MWIVWMLLVLASVPAHIDEPRFDDLEVRSDNGRFVAQVRRSDDDPGSPRNRAQFAVTVYELDGDERAKRWSAPYAYRGSSEGHLLTDDGQVFVHVDERLANDRPLVEGWRGGKRLFAFTARDLHVDGREQERWLADARPAARLRVASKGKMLDVLARDGRVRTIDLDKGALSGPSLDHSAMNAEVSPEAGSIGQESTGAAYVEGFACAIFAEEGFETEVRVRGSLPTPTHRFIGFSLEVSPGDATRLVLTPRVAEPSAETVSVQMLAPFEQVATIRGLQAGSYRVEVRGRADRKLPPRPLIVVSEGTMIALRTSGGITGETRFISVSYDGHVETFSSRAPQKRSFFAPVDVLEDLAGRNSGLSLQPPAQTSQGADLTLYEIASLKVQPQHHDLATLVRDDKTIDANLREIVSLLQGLAPAADDSRTNDSKEIPAYTIDARTSSFTVRTSSSGCLSAFGHDHEIAIQNFEGEVRAASSDLQHAALNMTIHASSLEVVDKESLGDQDAIEKEMREHVFETTAHPEISFKSTAVKAKPLGENKYDLTITGDLVLHGVTKSVVLPAHLEIDDKIVHASGAFSIRQTDFGITPTSVAGGTVKVADKVDLVFDITARRR